MDTTYEARVRETALAMGIDRVVVERMFSDETNAMLAARDAKQDAAERHQEARKLALAHIAKEQAEAEPDRYEEQFAEFARGMGVDARTLEAMQALPSGGLVSEARVRDLTARYAEALRVQDGGGDDRPFEATGEFVAPRLEDDKFYKYMLDNARFADARNGGNRSETDVRRLWEAKVGLMRLEHNERRQREQAAQASGEVHVQEAAVYPLDVQDAPEAAYRVKLIQAGPTATGKRYYEGTALRKAVDAGRFDGLKMYLNHQKAGDMSVHGHRDLRDWAATIKPGSVTFDPVSGEVWGVVVPHDPRVQTILSTPTARRSLGVSVDANVRVKRGADGLDHIEDIAHLHSVDFVPEGNATG